jgi:LL-diaminopimelate aminotransferase
MFETSRRTSLLQQSVFTDLRAEKEQYEKRTGQPVIDFSLGSPDIPPAKSVMETLSSAAQIPANYRYAVSALPSLIAQIQSWYKTRFGVDLADNEIALLQGSQEALINLPLLYCNPGDGVLVPDPYYPAYVDAPLLAQAEILYMPLLEENDYLIDFDTISLEARKQAKMMIVCYPNNPTGAVATDAFIEKLIAFAKENEILVVYDSAYADLVFEKKPARSFLSYPGAKEVGIELNSFSKSYGMAGARLGVMCGNPQVIAQYKKLKSAMDYGIFLPVQLAGITALQTGAAVVEKTREIYIQRRALIKDLFTKAGWNLTLSDATMFLWVKIPDSYSDSEAFASALLQKTGILTTPGTSFGDLGKRYVRIALVVDEEDIKEAAKRLEQTRFFEKI